MNLEGWNNGNLHRKKKWSIESIIFGLNELRGYGYSLDQLIEDFSTNEFSEFIQNSKWNKFEIIDLLERLNQKFK